MENKMDISKITESLYVSAELQPFHSNEVDTRHISLIISMIGRRYPPKLFEQPPYNFLWLKTFDSVLFPIPMKSLMQGVRVALPIIKDGGKVLVYCAKGRHRSIAMTAAILIAMGYTAHEAMELICAQRKSADPNVWHIARRIRKFEKHWHSKMIEPNSNTSSLEELYAELSTALISKILLRLGRLFNK
jgi:protein-tyrosine phosphatase